MRKMLCFQQDVMRYHLNEKICYNINHLNENKIVRVDRERKLALEKSKTINHSIYQIVKRLIYCKRHFQIDGKCSIEVKLRFYIQFEQYFLHIKK